MDGVVFGVALLGALAVLIGVAVLVPTPRKRFRAAMKRYGLAHSNDVYGRYDVFEGELPEGRAYVRGAALGGAECPLEVRVGGALPVLGEAAALAIVGAAPGWRYEAQAWRYRGSEVADARAVIERGRELARALGVAVPMSEALRIVLADTAALRAARGTATWDEAADVVRSEADPAVRLRLALRMGEPSLLEALACDMTEVGARALDELIQLAPGGDEATRVLDAYVARRDDMDARGQERLAVALRRCPYARATEVLGAMLAHDDAELRLVAAESLRAVGTVAAVPALARLAARSGTAEHVARAAIAAIQARAEGAAAGGLALVEASAAGALAIVPEP